MRAPHFHRAVDTDQARLDGVFCVAAAVRGAGQFQERTQRERTVDGYVAQLLSRIGMIR